MKDKEESKSAIMPGFPFGPSLHYGGEPIPEEAKEMFENFFPTNNSGGWIKVSDRLPERFDRYLVVTDTFPPRVDIVCYVPFLNNWSGSDTVIKWQPLPSANG